MPPPSNSRKQPQQPSRPHQHHQQQQQQHQQPQQPSQQPSQSQSSQSSQPSQPLQQQPVSAPPPQRTVRSQRQRAEKPHPPVAYLFLEDNPPSAPRLSAASITPIAPSVRQSTFSDLDDALRPSPAAADRPPLPPFPTLQTTGHPPKPTEAERYKNRYLNRRTLPAPAPSTTFAAAATTHNGRPRTQSLGSRSGSASSASTSTSTTEPQRSTASHHHHHHHQQQHHHHRRTPSNPTLPAIVERPLPAVPRRIPISQDSRNHVHFHTHPPKSAPHAAPSDPPRLAKINDDSRGLNLTSASPTSTLVHSASASPLQEQHYSPKTPSKKRLFPLNKNFNKFFRRGRSASVDCHDHNHDTATQTSTEQQKRPTTPTPTPSPNKFSSLPAISTSNISRPIMRRSTSHIPTARLRFRHPAEMSAAAVKRVRRVTPLTEVDMDSKKEWRSSFINERKVPVYHPPADSPYASHGR